MNKITAMTIATSLSTSPAVGTIDTREYSVEEANHESNSSQEIRGIEALSSLSGVVATDSLNVRSTPDTSRTPIGKVYRGDVVDIISQESNGWYKINFNGKIGYVSNKYIEVQSAPTPDYSIQNMNKKGEVYNVSGNTTLNVRNMPNTNGNILYTLKNGEEIKITGKTSNGWYRVIKDNVEGFASAKYIKEKSEIIAGKVVNVADNDTLNVRESASASSKVLYTLKNNTSVDIVEKLSNGWIKISCNGKDGYVNGKYIKEVAIEEAPGESTVGEKYEVTNTINLRKTASWSGEIIKVINKGELLDVVSINSNWAKVYINGDYAYAPAMYLNKVEVEKPSNPKPQTTTYIATENINLRETNSWSGNIIRVIKKGETVEVIEISGDWAKVYHMDNIAYAPSKYLEINKNNTAPEVPSEPQAPVIPQTTDYKVKVDINMRDNNAWSATVLKTIKAGEIVKVVSIDGEWAKIYDNGVYGYVPSQYLVNENEEEIKPEAPITPETTDYVVTGDINMRTSASWSGDIIKVIKTGEVVKVVEIEGAWAKVYDNGVYGYVPSQYLINEDNVLPELPDTPVMPDTPTTPEKPETPENSEISGVPQTTLYITTDTVNVRESNAWSATILKTLKADTVVEVVSIEGEWAKIYDNGTYGFVPASYLIDKKSYEENVKYTKYNYTMSAYVEAQRKKAPSHSTSTFTSYINPELGHKYEFLELNKFREINVDKLNDLLAKNNAGVLIGQGQAIYNTAKKFNIDALYFLSQSIHETGYGKSTLAKGVTITEIADKDKPIKDSNGNITGYKMIPLSEPVTVYNLYGIGAEDNLPTMPNRALVLGTTYAYNKGWTSVEKAIEGAGSFVSSGYINSTKYNQNTLYKMRYNPNSSYLWHQYSTTPWYARDIAKTMEKFDDIYEKDVIFSYDKPKFNDSKNVFSINIIQNSDEIISKEEDDEFMSRIGKPDITKIVPTNN